MAALVQLATPEDMDGLLDVYYSAFGSEAMLQIFPSTPGGREFMRQWYAALIKSVPGHQQSKVFIVRENGKIVSSAVWYIIGPNDGGCWHWRKRLPALQEGMNEEKVNGFFMLMEPQQAAMMQDEPRLFLNVLCTHEAHRKKGHAGALLAAGNDLADEMGYPCYLDAADKAKSLYEKMGYEAQPRTSPNASWPMYRKRKTAD